jgi:hypothetical protein
MVAVIISHTYAHTCAYINATTQVHAQECRHYSKNINRLKAAVVSLLVSLLECVDSPYIPERMLASLDSYALISNINGLLAMYNPTLAAERLVKRCVLVFQFVQTSCYRDLRSYGVRNALCVQCKHARALAFALRDLLHLVHA